jgi:hypothetical protein
MTSRVGCFDHWGDGVAGGFGRSLFDAAVVGMSLIVLGPLDFPISILRALRVVRLFGRLKCAPGGCPRPPPTDLFRCCALRPLSPRCVLAQGPQGNVLAVVTRFAHSLAMLWKTCNSAANSRLRLLSL